MTNVRCYKPGFRFRYLARCVIFTLASLFLTGILLYQPVINELQIIHFKHRQELLKRSQQLKRFFKSTCSWDADQRGPHQKVIAYAVFGDFSRDVVAHKYLNPYFIQTIKTIPSIFPGWIVRIYHNLTNDVADRNAWKTLQNILNLGSHVDLCNATEIIEKLNFGDLFGMTWRWLPLLDEMVETFMSRDSDSRIIPREEEAVREWLASNKTYHIMRDHPAHCIYAILGGMWGVKVNRDRSRIVCAFKKIFTTHHLHQYNYDQYLLKKYIWPMATTNMVAHDSYCCEYFSFSKPFPTHRKDGLFVGGRDLPEEDLKNPCPEKCRPSNATTDWMFC